MFKIYKIIIYSLVLIGCSHNQKPSAIFNYSYGNEIEETYCVQCGINPILWTIALFSGETTQQINPNEYEGLYKKYKDSIPVVNCSKDFGLSERARNDLLAASLRLADASISEHLGMLKATEIDMNLILGAATAGLTGGASVAGAATAKSLSAAATGTNAFKSIFNESTYRNALGETLIGAIDAELISQKVDIVNSMITKNSCHYPLELGLADIQRYLNSGSFYNGLALIRKASEQHSSTVIVQANKIQDTASSVPKVPGVQVNAKTASIDQAADKGTIDNKNGFNNRPNDDGE